MFATITPVAPHTGRPRPVAAVTARPPRRRIATHQTVDEAYEMRLLAEVARWDDQAAFEEIYARHSAAVMRAAQRVCRDTCVAEEIVQQTFTALWVRAERLVDKSVRLRPWLTTVARNAAIDHLRGERYAEPIATAEAIASTAPSPLDLALFAQSAGELALAVAELSGDQRAAINAVYIAGMTYVAAADALGEPVGTIKSRVRLALGHLRARLGAGR
jgi:RNA polymerase sigma-70 factor (ECF subfamily)